MDEKTNEIKAIPELLEDISLYFKEEIFRREKKELDLPWCNNIVILTIYNLYAIVIYVNITLYSQ